MTEFRIRDFHNTFIMKTIFTYVYFSYACDSHMFTAVHRHSWLRWTATSNTRYVKGIKKKDKKKNNSFRDKTPAMEKQRTRIKYEVT